VVDVRLPVHWRSVTWLLATWVTGACATVREDAAAPVADPRPDVVVTADPAAAVSAGADPAALVAVALPALATAFGPGLPTGAWDGAAEVRLRGDVFVPPVAPGPADPALAVGAGAPVTHADLLRAAVEAARAARLPPRARLLSSAGPGRAIEELLAPLVVDGSVVLLLPGRNAEEIARIAAQEHAVRSDGAG
jgi:uncharacterized protein (TIGR03089 family)